MDDRPAATESGGTADDLWVHGVWVGPRSLRLFLRVNRFFVAWCLFILALIALAFWSDVGGVSSWFAFPLSIVTGAVLTLVIMFAFSRGWVREGD
jgi:hypothetical protein